MQLVISATGVPFLRHFFDIPSPRGGPKVGRWERLLAMPSARAILRSALPDGLLAHGAMQRIKQRLSCLCGVVHLTDSELRVEAVKRLFERIRQMGVPDLVPDGPPAGGAEPPVNWLGKLFSREA